MIYKDKNRKTGSQSETPSIRTGNNSDGKKVVNIGGYQIFSLIEDGGIIVNQKKEKFNMISKILNDLYKDKNNKTITDIGCSSGLTSFICQKLGYKKIQSLDHDKEYVDLINKACEYLNINNIDTSVSKFGDYFEKSDVVIMLALIHWIFSCTSEYGSFDLIFEQIKDKVGEYLLIEWVDPKDGAIKYFNHISYNKDTIKEDYNLENFEKSILKNFSSIENKIKIDGDYRILYIIKNKEK
jgi:SAM-dependent methyltransferase